MNYATLVYSTVVACCLCLAHPAITLAEETGLKTLLVRFPGHRARYDFNTYLFDRRTESEDGSVKYHLTTGDTVVVTRNGRRFWNVRESPVYTVVREYFDDPVARLRPWPKRHFTGFIDKYRNGRTIRFLSPYEVPGLYSPQRVVRPKAVPKTGSIPLSADISGRHGLVIVGGEHFPAVVARWMDGKAVARLESDREHSAVVEASFSPNGKHILTASRDGLVRLWQTSDGTLHREFRAESSVTCAEFTSDGHSVVVGSRDGSIRRWQVNHDSEPEVIEANGASATSIGISPDGKQTVIGHANGQITLLEIAQRLQIGKRIEAHESGVTAIAFRPPNARSFATGSSSGDITIWQASGSPLDSPDGHHGSVNALSFARDGQRLLSGGADGQIKIFSVGGRRSHVAGVFATGKPVESIVFHPDGRGYVVCRRGTSPTIRDLITYESGGGYLLADPVRDKGYRERSLREQKGKSP